MFSQTGKAFRGCPTALILVIAIVNDYNMLYSQFLEGFPLSGSHQD